MAEFDSINEIDGQLLAKNNATDFGSTVHNTYGPQAKSSLRKGVLIPKLDMTTPKPPKSFTEVLNDITGKEEDDIVDSKIHREELASYNIKRMLDDAKDVQKRCLDIISTVCGRQIETLDQAKALSRVLPQYVDSLPVLNKEKFSKDLFWLRHGDYYEVSGLKNLRDQVRYKEFPLDIPDDGTWKGILEQTRLDSNKAYNALKKLEKSVDTPVYTKQTGRQIVEDATRIACDVNDVVNGLNQLSLCKDLELFPYQREEARRRKAVNSDLQMHIQQRYLLSFCDPVITHLSEVSSQCHHVGTNIRYWRTEDNGEKPLERGQLGAIERNTTQILESIETIRNQYSAVKGVRSQKSEYLSATSKQLLDRFCTTMETGILPELTKLQAVCESRETASLAQLHQSFFKMGMDLSMAYPAIEALVARERKLDDFVSRRRSGQVLAPFEP